MTESRCSTSRICRKGFVQIYIKEELYDAIVELQGDNNPEKMLQYIKTKIKYSEVKEGKRDDD